MPPVSQILILPGPTRHAKTSLRQSALESKPTPVIIIIALAAARSWPQREEKTTYIRYRVCWNTHTKNKRRPPPPFLCNCCTHAAYSVSGRVSAAVISLKRGHLCETDLKFRSRRCVLNIVTECDFAYTYLIY